MSIYEYNNCCSVSTHSFSIDDQSLTIYAGNKFCSYRDGELYAVVPLDKITSTELTSGTSPESGIASAIVGVIILTFGYIFDESISIFIGWLMLTVGLSYGGYIFCRSKESSVLNVYTMSRVYTIYIPTVQILDVLKIFQDKRITSV